MPGKHIIGIIGECRRQNEGEYLIPMCTVFGLKAAEREFLVKNQVKLDLSDQITDKNRDNEGIEVATSAYKLMRILGEEFGFEPSTPQISRSDDTRISLIWQMTKDVSTIV